MNNKLLKSSAVVSLMTFISRVLGLVRDMVVANLMGAGTAADVFFFANKIPNFLRRLFAEGAFAQAFVPVLIEVKNDGGIDASRLFIARISGTLGTVISLITIVAIIGSSAIAALFGFGWFLDWLNGGEHSSKFELASMMLKITFPYLWFITLTALSGAILNTWGKFGVAAFTPVFLNIAIIACAIWLSPYFSEPAFALAWGVFFGGLVQFLFQLPFLLKLGLLVKPKWAWNDPKVAKVRKLMLPAIFGVSVSQINLLLDTLIASFLVTGSISWLYYSDRLLEFPLGLFGIAIATVILPALSQKHVEKSPEHFAATMDWGIRMVLVLGLPAAVGLVVLAKPMLMVLFMRGAFTNVDVTMAGASLIAYASGLLSFMLVKVLAPGYFSRQDTKTPVKYGIWAMLANMLFNIGLAVPFGYVGLAAATAMSATLNAVLLYLGLKRQNVFKISRTTWIFVLRVIVAAGSMAFFVSYMTPEIQIWLDFDQITRVINLAFSILIGVITYIAVFFVIGGRIHHFKATEQRI